MSISGNNVDDQPTVFDVAIEEDALLKETLLAPSPEVRNSVEYYLQLCLRSPNVSLHSPHSKMWQIHSSHVSLQFAKRSQGLHREPSLVDVSHLNPQTNSLHQVLSHGFTFPPNAGMIFNVGSIRNDTMYTQDDSDDDSVNGDVISGPRIRQFILCELAIGKPYPVAQALLDDDGMPDLPHGYHSFRVLDDTKEDENTSEESNAKSDKARRASKMDDEYRNRFLITDSTQVLPLYFIQLDLSNYTMSDEEKCTVCDTRDATVYCEEDRAPLCDTCDRAVHGANKLVGRHTRVLIGEKRRSDFGHCPFHSSEAVQFFCPTCQTPVCVHCKMTGNHSTGNQANHRLIQIKEAYRAAIEESQEEDASLTRRMLILRDQQSLVGKKVDQVNKNATDMDEQIYELLRVVIQRLTQLQKNKLEILEGEALELDRMAAEISWAESFLKQQQQRATPVQFLMAWQRHQNYRKQLFSASKISHFTVNVKADIMLRGTVEAIETGQDIDEVRSAKRPQDSDDDDEDDDEDDDLQSANKENSSQFSRVESPRRGNNSKFRNKLFTDDGYNEIPLTPGTRRLSQMSAVGDYTELDHFLRVHD